MLWGLLFGKKRRAAVSKSSLPTPMPIVLGADATPSAKAANLKATVTAFAAAVVCTTKMVNDGERVEFYPTYRDIEFPAIRTRLPAVGLNPVIRYNVY